MSRPTMIRLIKYLICGGLGFLSNLGIFYVLTTYGNIPYLYSASISFILAGFISYSLQKRITYQDTTKTSTKKLSYFYAFNVINIGVNAGILFVLVEYLNLEHIIALVVSNLAIAIYSYVVYKKVIFV